MASYVPSVERVNGGAVFVGKGCKTQEEAQEMGETARRWLIAGGVPASVLRSVKVKFTGDSPSDLRKEAEKINNSPERCQMLRETNDQLAGLVRELIAQMQGMRGEFDHRMTQVIKEIGRAK